MRKPAGFTLIEMLIVVMIIAIATTVALDALGDTEANMRADRASREACCAIQYARSMAIATGATYGVEFDTTNKRFQVFLTTGSNVVAQPMVSGGTYVINLTRPELNGTVMSVSLANDTTNPYDLTFSPLGSTANNGTVTFTYAGKTKTVNIPKVGDPTLQ